MFMPFARVCQVGQQRRNKNPDHGESNRQLYCGRNKQSKPCCGIDFTSAEHVVVNIYLPIAARLLAA